MNVQETMFVNLTVVTSLVTQESEEYNIKMDLKQTGRENVNGSG